MKRAAIIGYGTIAPVHLAAILANPNIELCAICDNDPAAQERIPESLRSVPFYTDYQELCEKEKPDAVHICLPHYLHVPVTEYFALQGVNVYCEKPVAMNPAQGREFVEFEAAHPEVKIAISLQNRLNRSTVELKKIIESGEYGKVIGCRGFVPWQRGKEYYDFAPWRGIMATAGGGSMINQSVHTLDLLYYLCGKITSLHGVTAQLLDLGLEVEDSVTARLDFENGAKGLFFATNCNYTNESVQIKVALEKAAFLIEDDILWKINPDATREKVCENEKMPGAKFYFGASHQMLIDKFYRAIETDGDDYVHVKDAEMSIRLIDAICESSRLGKPVSL